MQKKMVPKTILSTAFMTLILLFILFKLTMTPAISGGAVDFYADTVSGDAPLTVHFTDNSNVHRDAWNWDFGDGVTDHSQNPVHTYNESGTYTVSLTLVAITNGSGSNIGSEVKTGYIHVADPAATMTATQGSVSVIPGIVETPVPPPATATPLPTAKASGGLSPVGGIRLSEDSVQLLLAGGIAVVIAVIIIIFFSSLGKRGETKNEEMSETRPEPKPMPPAAPRRLKAQEKPAKPAKPAKNADDLDISQDYLYSLVKGKVDDEAERPLPPLQNDNEKIK